GPHRGRRRVAHRARRRAERDRPASARTGPAGAGRPRSGRPARARGGLDAGAPQRRAGSALPQAQGDRGPRAVQVGGGEEGLLVKGEGGHRWRMTPERWLVLGVSCPSGEEERAGLLTEGLLALGGRAVREEGGRLVTHLPEPPDPDAFVAEALARLRSFAG